MIDNMFDNDVVLFLFTCVKNGRSYIGKLFESLLNQSCTKFVHYIYDNGSTIPIDDLVCNYTLKASQLKNPFKVIYEKTESLIGLNMATRHCIDVCDKPYFIWIDCDNWVHKDFIKYLLNEIKKHPNKILYRTCLYKVDDFSGQVTSNFKERRTSTKDFNSAAFTFFTRKNKYYYSFFAVNKNKYFLISENDILDLREYYNDEQVLAYCYFSKDNFSMVKNSIGYYLSRNDSEAHLIKPAALKNELFAFDIRKCIAEKISSEAKDFYLLINKLFEEYNCMQNDYANKQYKLAKNHFLELVRLSKANHFPLRATFRNKDYFYWFITLHLKARFIK